MCLANPHSKEVSRVKSSEDSKFQSWFYLQTLKKKKKCGGALKKWEMFRFDEWRVWGGV